MVKKKSFLKKVAEGITSKGSRQTKFSKEASRIVRKIDKKLEKSLSKKLKHKRILKKSQSTVVIKQIETPSILGEPNRFFKDELEEVRQTLFFR